MRNPSRPLGLTASLVGLLAACNAQAAPAACSVDPPILRAALEMRYGDLKAAMAARNRAAIAAVLAPGFTSEEVDGAISDAAKMLDGLMRLPADPRKVSKTELVSVIAGEGTAEVVQRYHMTTVTAGTDGAERAVDLTSESADAWTCAAGTWLLRRTRTDKMDVLINGVSAMHAVRGKLAD